MNFMIQQISQRLLNIIRLPGMTLAPALATILLLGGLAAPLPADDTPIAEHLILISIDGFNPQWYQDEGWPAPLLQEKAREGAYARRALPPFPSTTRPGHVTLLTGWLPARHGVFNNSMPYRLEEDSSILHAVHAAGGVTAAVVWPGSGHGPPDHTIHNLRFIDFSDAETVPPTEGLISAGDGADRPGHSRNYERYITGTVRDARMMAIGVTFIEKHRPNFLALRFNDTDTTQHRFGRDGAAVRGIVASTDMGLAEIVAAVERAGIADKTVFIVTGDHGMDDIRTHLRPNVWLDEAGLGDPEGPRFEAYGGSAFLHDSDGDEKEEILAMLDALPEEDRRGFTILSRDKLDEIGADPRAVFALNATEGHAFHASWKKPARLSVNRGQHGSRPTPASPNNYTGFVAWGPGIEPGTVLDEIGLEDVAPTAAEFLSVDLGERDGRSLVPKLRGQ